jgi:hypothetical protein
MNPNATHIKHVVIAAAFIGAAIFGITRYHDASIELAKIDAATKEKVAIAQRDIAVAQASKQTAQQSIVTTDADTARKLASLQSQLNSKPDSSQIKTIIQEALPGVKTVEAKDAQGNAVLAVADTQENRDKINQADASFKSCRFSLDGCEANRLQFENVIKADNLIIERKDTQIKGYEDEIKKLKTFGKGGNFWARTGRVIIPVACAGAGAYLGANKGTKSAAIGAVSGGALCAVTVRF